MRQEITCSQFMSELDSWVGRGVAIRVTAENGVLVAVFHGVLRERSAEKHPATFWPLVHAEPIEHLDHLERPGIYLHPGEVEGLAVHVGENVLEVRQGAVTLNLRRL
jgi:hypothetical protein